VLSKTLSFFQELEDENSRQSTVGNPQKKINNMEVIEIKLGELIPERFIEEKVEEISSKVGSNYAINALSGGVDSSVVTMLGK